MSRASRIAGVSLVAAAMLGLVWASNAPMTTHASADGILRLAWSAQPERIETCREASEEELANVPAHMRQPRVCEGTTATYRLEVRHNGDLIAEQVLRGGGLRRDRRLYVYRELPVPAGDADIAVRLDRIESPDSHAEGQAASSGAATATVPAQLSLTQRVRFAPRQVVLVTYDADRRALTAVQADTDESIE
jgi:hypothetical protein